MKEEDKIKIKNDLLERGYIIDNINELMKLSKEDRILVPYFLELLTYLSDEYDKELIVRSLCVKGFTEAIPLLIKEFKVAKREGYKWAIGNTICYIQDKTAEKELLKLIVDKQHGASRQMIVYGMGIYKTPETKKALLSLLDDEEVHGHVLYALRKCGDESCIPYIEPFLKSPRTFVRNEAKKAIERINKRVQKEK